MCHVVVLLGKERIGELRMEQRTREIKMLGKIGK
jgi:hypothetical protein